MPLAFFKFGEPIDFNNAVIVGSLFFLLSIPVALYTGLVASRAITFFQSRYRAALWPHTVLELGKDASNPHDFMMALSGGIAPLIFELRALGHRNAADDIARIFGAYGSRLAAMMRISHGENQMPEFPVEIAPEIWLGLKLQFMDFYLDRMNADLEAISGLRPNLWPLFTPRPFPNYFASPAGFTGLMTRDEGRGDARV